MYSCTYAIHLILAQQVTHSTGLLVDTKMALTPPRFTTRAMLFISGLSVRSSIRSLLWFTYLPRIALIHSKHLWLGTHFDPFYPALYIHKSHSTLSKNLGILPVNWSAFSVPGTIGDNEIGYAMKSFGRRLWETALNWRSASWDNWGDAFTESAIAPSWPSWRDLSSNLMAVLL